MSTTEIAGRESAVEMVQEYGQTCNQETKNNHGQGCVVNCAWRISGENAAKSSND
jgi:hypothetical protein